VQHISKATVVLLGTCAATLAAFAEEGPTILVEFVVEDRRGAPITDIKATEIELRQEGVAQVVSSLEASRDPGGYIVRYVPRSGRAGPLLLRVLRAGSVARGPGGGALKIRVVEPLKPVERRLLAALDAAEPPRGIEHEAFVLRYEKDADRVHHTFVVEVPLARVELGAAGGPVRGSLGLMAQVKDAAGRVVQRFSLDYAIEGDVGDRGKLRTERVVWTSHLHLDPGRYLLETVVGDQLSSLGGVRRIPFEALPVGAGLRVSSVSVLAPEGALPTEETSADNPLRYSDRQLVPSFGSRWVTGGLQQLPFHVVLFPDASDPAPVQASVELYRQGALVARGSIELPPGAGAIPYVGSFPVARLPAGAYEMRIVARQGGATAQESTTFEMVPPSRVGALTLGPSP
jgi:hypothetical protein